jgi:folylpolyglutamate synthase/dihydropteroate synthase
MRDKDLPSQMELIRKYTDRIGLVKVNYHRAESLENLFTRAVELNFREIKTYPGVKEMLENLSENSIILGSLFLVGEVKRYLKGR